MPARETAPLRGRSPERATELFAKNRKAAEDRYEHLTRLVELYK